jgi:hypothetical protein
MERRAHPFQHQNAVFLFHFSHDLCFQVVGTQLYLARCQRAGKGARESAARRSH